MPFSAYICQFLKVLRTVQINEYLIQSLYLAIFALSVSVAHSQEKNIHTTIHPTKVADTKHLIVPQSTQQYTKIVEKGYDYFKQKNYPAAILQYKHSLEYLLKDDKATQKKRGKTYTKIAESYKRLKNRKETRNFYKKSLDIYTELNDKKYMARTLKLLAETERYLGHLVIALDYSNQSLKVYNTINDPKGYAQALMGAGIIHRYIGRYEKSLIHIREAYLYYKKINDYNGIAKTSNEMGNIYIRLEQFKQARYFFQKTINIPEDKLELKTIASALRSMAVIEFKHENYQTAMLYAKKAYKIYTAENEALKTSITARIIANIYRAQKDNINAIHFYKKSMAIAIENNSEKHQIQAQLPLAEMLVAQDSDKAINMLTTALKIAIKIKDDKQIFHSYNKLSLAEKYRGNFKAALDYAKKEIELAKIIQNKSEDTKLTLAKATLHSYKMEIELENLRERTKLDKLELIKKNNEIEIANQARTINELKLIKNQYASIALAFLLLILIFLVVFIYYLFIVSKKRNKTLHYLASRDPLTNCYNRRSLFNFMDKYLSGSDVNTEYCIIMVDIDNFKNINDTYGHTTGDTVICDFTSVLQSCVGENDIVARIGGEEFCIVLHHVNWESAIDIAESMRIKVESSIFNDVKITSSFGVTSLQFGATTSSKLIEQADLALYKSKYVGRNTVTLWEESLKTRDDV